MTTTCPECGGRLFRRTVNGWQRCVCYWETVSQYFIRPQIREKDPKLPPEWLGKEPWPLEDRTEHGSYRDFRLMVWRSLLPHSIRAFRYDYFDASRLAEIQFGRDVEEYRSVRDLVTLDLLVLVVGLVDPPNQYLPSLIEHVTALRRMHGRPTWVFTARGEGKAPPRLMLPPPATSPDDPIW